MAQVEKEHRWLPLLAPQLPLLIPSPLVHVAPGAYFPFPWSVYAWIDGDLATVASVDDDVAFARDLADFLTTLFAIDSTDGPAAGAHNFWRGGPLATYDRETRATIAGLERAPIGPGAPTSSCATVVLRRCSTSGVPPSAIPRAIS